MTLLQSFQGLMLHFQAVNDLLPPGEAKEGLEKALERADRAIVEGRDAIQNLRSSAAATNELAESIAVLGEQLGKSGMLRVSVEGPHANCTRSFGTIFIGSGARLCKMRSPTPTQIILKQKSRMVADSFGCVFGMMGKVSIRGC
jgi:hypothetical protein